MLEDIMDLKGAENGSYHMLYERERDGMTVDKAEE